MVCRLMPILSLIFAFLPNPHYVESLRPQTGKDDEVSQYVMKWAETKQIP